MKWILFMVTVFAIACTNKVAPPPQQVCDTSVVSYHNDIVPLIQSSCLSCHSAPSPSAGINLADSASFFFYVNEGSFYGAVSWDGSYALMPPDAKLDDCSMAKITKWKNEGYPANQ